jgi:histidinol phosphatase-like PHP family hydrolase
MRYPVDDHIHTMASGHAFSTLQENARHAASLGLKLIACTDHAMAMPGGPGWIYFSALRMVAAGRRGIEVLRGVEANILDLRASWTSNALCAPARTGDRRCTTLSAARPAMPRRTPAAWRA